MRRRMIHARANPGGAVRRARGRSRRGLLTRARGPVRHHDPRRLRRRRHQGRAAHGRRHPPLEAARGCGRRSHVLRQRQPQQALGRTRPHDRGGPRRGAPARGIRRRHGRELPARRDGSVRAVRRRPACGESRPRLLLDHRVRPGCDARRIRPARAGGRRPHVHHGRARRRTVQGGGGPRRRALRAERRRRDPARPARARPHGHGPARRGEPAPEPALRAHEPGGLDARDRPCAPAPRQPASEHRAVCRVPGRRPRPRHRGRQRPAVPRARVGPRHPGHRRRSSLRDERDPRRAPRPPARRTRGGPRRPPCRALGGGAHRSRRARGPRERRGRGARLRGVARPRSGGRARCEPHRRNPIALSGAAPDYRTPPPRLDEHAGADWLPASEKGPAA